MNENGKDFAERIKHLRDTLGLTQEEFAKACGLSQKQISYYETGIKTPTLKTLKKIVRAFHINPNQFF